MLPMTVLRRFDCVLSPPRPKFGRLRAMEGKAQGRSSGCQVESGRRSAVSQPFRPLDFQKLKGDPDHIASSISSATIRAFQLTYGPSSNISSLKMKSKRCARPTSSIWWSPSSAMWTCTPTGCPTSRWGSIFENLIRRFNELANETAGDHFTPREVIRLMVSILSSTTTGCSQRPAQCASCSNPALRHRRHAAESQNYLREHHNAARLVLCMARITTNVPLPPPASDMLMKAGGP